MYLTDYVSSWVVSVIADSAITFVYGNQDNVMFAGVSIHCKSEISTSQKVSQTNEIEKREIEEEK